MSLEKKFTEETGNSPLIETDAGDYYSAMYVEWLEDRIGQLNGDHEVDMSESNKAVDIARTTVMTEEQALNLYKIMGDYRHVLEFAKLMNKGATYKYVYTSATLGLVPAQAEALFMVLVNDNAIRKSKEG